MILQVLVAVAGVAEADVDLRTQQATIRFEAASTSTAAIAAALAAAGHPPRR